MNHELTNEALLTVPIRDDEIFELLERLAATEDMFKAPVSTIRDVAELTEASPNLIARILGEMRGPGELEKITNRLDFHEARLRAVEQKVSQPPASTPTIGSTVKSIPPIIRRQVPTVVVDEAAKKKSDEAWKRYKVRLEQEGSEDSFYEQERLSRRTPLTVVTVIIAIIIVIWVVASAADTGRTQRWDYPPYRNIN